MSICRKAGGMPDSRRLLLMIIFIVPVLFITRIFDFDQKNSVLK
jgi:hypothetical protein